MRSQGRRLSAWALGVLLGLAAWASTAVRAQEIEVAGDLLVELDAGDPTAGSAVWVNTAFESIGDFVAPGALPVQTGDLAGMPAVTFNSTAVLDVYQSPDLAPPGLVGTDPTATIEAWVYNPGPLVAEETIVAWGHRYGNLGENYSFNYGTNGAYGAMGHFHDPDMGWVVAGGAPAPDQWHHLVYTFDGTTQRVYADGVQWNQEDIPGVLNIFPSYITLAAQNIVDGTTPELSGLRGTLSIGRLRIHDEALTAEQVLNNYTLECEEFCPPEDLPTCDNCPVGEDSLYKGKGRYVRQLTFAGFPTPTSSTVTAPAGATLSPAGLLEYVLPAPEPASFAVTVESTNDSGTATFSWTVTLVGPPDRGDIEVAEELFVELYAEDPSAGTTVWLNSGTLGDFGKIGEPIVEDIGVASSPAVSFNQTLIRDAYQCFENAPAGLVGPDPTRSIEVWAFNPAAVDEETLVAWGHRGGPAGTNMSFNYGVHATWGAVGHWDAPDIGWNNAGGAPLVGEWHHLVYTYDGTTTRVYSDGVQQNFEVLGNGVINTYADTPITLATQIAPAGGRTLEFGGLSGTLSIGRVRVHDGVLSLTQIRHNFDLERDLYGVGPIPPEAPLFVDAPPADSVLGTATTYTRRVTASGSPTPTYAVTEPAGATIDADGLLTYDLPAPPPDSFVVTITATNAGGDAEATWVVTVVKPVTPPAGPVHLYTFTTDASDSESGEDGLPYGDVTFEDGQAVLNNLVDGVTIPSDRIDPTTGAYIDLPNGLITALGSQATFEAWVTWRGPQDWAWQRIFDFGTSVGGEDTPTTGFGANYFFMTPYSGNGTHRSGYYYVPPLGIATERMVDGPALPLDEEVHVALVWDDETSLAVLYRNGVEVARDTAKHLTLPDLIDNNNWLGRSQFGADAMFVGSYNEFRIYDYPLSASEVLGSYVAGPTPDEPIGGTLYRRGDANADGALNITDGIFVLNYLFLGGQDPPCLEAADTNGDDAHNITDGIYVLNYLFLGGPAPPDPGPDVCGPDPDGDADGMGCASYPQDGC